MDILRRRARDLRNTTTDAERHLWRYLRLQQLGHTRFRRQHPVAGYVLDFACPTLKLAIELDGSQHLDQQAYDAARSRTLQAHGYSVLRFWNDDGLLRTEQVLECVLLEIERLRAGQGS
jgi:very-short-patch-repair endonuclease